LNAVQGYCSTAEDPLPLAQLQLQKGKDTQSCEAAAVQAFEISQQLATIRDFSNIDKTVRFLDLRDQLKQHTQSYGLSNVGPKILTPFLLRKDDPQVAFQSLKVVVDDVELTTPIYFPRLKPDGHLPCIIWLHGGSMYGGGGLFLHAPNEFPTNRHSWEWTYSATFDRQTEARFFASQNIAFAVITINPNSGQNDICQQIKSQVEAIKGLDFIDTNRMIFVGHSNGGYALSLLVNKDSNFLQQNFKNGIVFASTYLAPGANYTMEDLCFFKFAAPDGQRLELATKKIRKLKGTKHRQYVLRHTYPLSAQCGMPDEELLEKLQGFPPIYILTAENDDITPPEVNGGMLAKRLGKLNQKIPQQEQKIKFEMRHYGKPVVHCLHGKPVVEDLLEIIQQP
jgi:acetyl esterase/lipase